jgi:hypothetical protein
MAGRGLTTNIFLDLGNLYLQLGENRELGGGGVRFKLQSPLT